MGFIGELFFVCGGGRGVWWEGGGLNAHSFILLASQRPAHPKAAYPGWVKLFTSSAPTPLPIRITGRVAALMRRTRFEEGMYIYVSCDDAFAEIARRQSPDESARFMPLFEARWRDKFEGLNLVLHKPCEGSTAFSMTPIRIAAILPETPPRPAECAVCHALPCSRCRSTIILQIPWKSSMVLEFTEQNARTYSTYV